MMTVQAFLSLVPGFAISGSLAWAMRHPGINSHHSLLQLLNVMDFQFSRWQLRQKNQKSELKP
jgi:hypothetical protein